MKKAYMVLNSTDVSDLLWCVMNTPARSEAERKRHLKLHARLLKIENELKIAAVIILVLEPDGVHEDGVVYCLRGGYSGGAPLIRELLYMFGRSFLKLVSAVLGADGYTRLYQDRKK